MRVGRSCCQQRLSDCFNGRYLYGDRLLLPKPSVPCPEWSRQSGSCLVDSDRSTASYPSSIQLLYYKCIMWSVRMRASKRIGQSPEQHISGAETLCSRRRISCMAQIFVDRAITHPRGMPDRIVLTIEEVTTPVKIAPILPFTQADCSNPASARRVAEERLRSIGISTKAIDAAFRILTAQRQMRGAALVDAVRGTRLEPDRSAVSGHRGLACAQRTAADSYSSWTAPVSIPILCGKR